VPLWKPALSPSEYAAQKSKEEEADCKPKKQSYAEMAKKCQQAATEAKAEATAKAEAKARAMLEEEAEPWRQVDPPWRRPKTDSDVTASTVCSETDRTSPRRHLSDMTQCSDSDPEAIDELMADDGFVVTKGQFLEILARNPQPFNRNKPRWDPSAPPSASSQLAASLLPVPPCLPPPPGLQLPKPELLEAILKSLQETTRRALPPPPGLTSDMAANAAPPPGLEHPSLPQGAVAPAAQESAAAPAVFEKPQVLLRNLPDAMMNEAMLWTMLEQANLEDGVAELNMRPGGKVLISLCGVEWVGPCVRHFEGRRWGASEPVSALFVRTVSKSIPTMSKEPTPAESTCSKPAAVSAPKAMNIHAPAFVPPSSLCSPRTAAAFNPQAAIFVPNQTQTQTHLKWERSTSPFSGSTDAGELTRERFASSSVGSDDVAMSDVADEAETSWVLSGI